MKKNYINRFTPLAITAFFMYFYFLLASLGRDILKKKAWFINMAGTLISLLFLSS